MGPRGRGGASRHVTRFPRAAGLVGEGRRKKGAGPSGKEGGLEQRVGRRRARGGGSAERGSARALLTSNAAQLLPPFAPWRMLARQLGLGQWIAPTSGECLVTARHRRERPFPFFLRFFPLPHAGFSVSISEFIPVLCLN